MDKYLTNYLACSHRETEIVWELLLNYFPTIDCRFLMYVYIAKLENGFTVQLLLLLT